MAGKLMTVSHAEVTEGRADCGGLILRNQVSRGASYSYCDECGAYAYDTCWRRFPSGIDEAANEAAFYDNDNHSPEGD